MVKISELRFPEFEGEWRLERLGTIADIQSGYAFSSLKMLREKSRYQLIKMSNVYRNKLSLERSPSYWLEINTKIEKFLLKKNDIVVTLTGTIGKQDYGYSVLIPKDDEFLLNQRLVRLRSNSTISIAEFILPVLKLSKFKYHFFNESKGGTGNQSNVGIEDLRNIKLLFPNLPEQTKIASFLTTVDKRINLLQKKKAELTQYKKGVMQKLFDVKADGCPALRFKQDDGSDFPDWEEKKLGEFAKYYDGTHQTPKYVEEGISFYSVEHVTANQFSQTKYISKDVFEKENKRVKLELGDILMTRIGSIGVAKYIDWDVNASFYVSLALIKQHGSFDGKYLSYAICADRFQRELWRRTIHVAFPQKINLGEIGECKILLPSLPEQQKIANVLSSIDKAIENIANQIEQSQKWKHGLLQTMFV